ncbi:MAG: general secretion pathway protein GspK [Syntrophales bacterium]
MFQRNNKTNQKKTERGIALIVVLLIISVVVAATLELNASSRSEIYEAANFRDQIRALYLAKSGFYCAQGVLSENTSTYDTLGGKWAKADLISAQSAALFDDGCFTVSVEDESGKIPVHKLVVNGKDYNTEIRDVLINFLSQPEFRLQTGQAAAIVDAIKDWIDTDSELTGGEKGQKEPPFSKNAPLDSIEELLMVKGISRDLFYGKDGVPGIAQYLTIFGDGRININTAPKLVLKSLSREITDDVANRMDSYRRSDRNELSGPDWYRKITGLSGLNIPSSLTTTRSRVFRITSVGLQNGLSKTVTGVVERGEKPTDYKIVFWKVSE